MPDLNSAVPFDGKRCVIGLDVGGTKIAGGVVTQAGEVQHKRVIPTEPRRGGEAVLDDTLRLAEELRREAAQARCQIEGIGICVPELVDLQGNIASSQTIDWRAVSLAHRFAGFGHVHVEADSRAAALAEALLGAGRPFKLFFYVTIGTGIGSCLVQHGQTYAGARGSAGTLASSPLPAFCARCAQWPETTLEEVASGPALVARYLKNLFPSGTNALDEALERPTNAAARAEDVLAAAVRGERIAAEIVSSAGKALGATLGLAVNLLDPEALVIGGGLGLAGGLYWESLVASTRRHIWSDTNRDVPIVPAGCGLDAGLIGAAMAAWRRVSGQD